MAELPPRARRILEEFKEFLKKQGTTSACAENTLPPPKLVNQKRNYLRVRGEYMGDAYQLAQALELPPRARRIQQGATILRKGGGTTSACAENTNPHT